MAEASAEAVLSEEFEEPGRAQDEAEATVSEGTPPTSTTTNVNEGTATNSVQAQTIEGGVWIGGALLHQAVIEAARWDQDELDRLRAVFVPPEGFEEFTEGVRLGGSGVVVGRPGSGRWAAAVRCALELRLTPRSITVDDGDDWAPAKLPCEEGHGYLLDLSEIRVFTDGMIRAIGDYAVRAKERGSAVLVVTDAAHWSGDDVRFHTLDVRPPAGSRVFARHLAVSQPESVTRRWLDHPGVSGVLRDASPAEAARLAAIALRRRPDTPLDEEGTAVWIKAVLDVFDNRQSEFGTLFGSRQGSEDGALYDRVLLVCVAVLEGQPAAEVVKAAETLADRLGVSRVHTTALSGPGLHRLIDGLGAGAVVRGGRVHFTRPDYADAVLDYVWEQYPAALLVLKDWSARVVDTGLADGCTRTIGDRWMALASRHGSPEWVVELFTEWSRHGATARAAVELGSRAAVHPRLGGALRRCLYVLATRPPRKATGDRVDTRRIPVGSAVVIEVCANYGRVHPNTALTRLKWLANDPQLADAVRAAVRELVDVTEIREFVLAELLEWVRFAARQRAVALPVLVDVLSRWDAGRDSGPPQEWLVRTWRAVLGHEPDTVQPAVDAWLSLVASKTADPEAVSEILARAVEGDFTRYHILVRCVGTWWASANAESEAVTLMEARLVDADPLRMGRLGNGAEQA